MSARTIQSITDSLVEIQRDYKKNDSHIPSGHLRDLQNALNRNFTDAKCTGVYYTQNSDKMFFGMCVMPKLSEEEVKAIIVSDDPIRVTSYKIEIDSKLLDPRLKLNEHELTAVVLHEVGHLVNSSAPIDEVRREVDVFIAQAPDDGKPFERKWLGPIMTPLMGFGITDAIRKIASMFENPNKEEILADEYVIRSGYGDHLISALGKIQKYATQLNMETGHKFVSLIWAIRVGSNLEERRIEASRTVKRLQKDSGSTLMKQCLTGLEKDLNVPTSFSWKEESLNEGNSFNNKLAAARYKYKYDVLRKYEDDYFEFTIRLKSVTGEEETLRLLRDVNMRLNVVEEFLNSDLTESDKKRFMLLQEKLIILREEITKKNISRDRMLGLWVEYPDIVPNRT